MKIVVLAGGTSTERTVSITSGTGISKAYARNYIVSMTNEQYHTAYTSISISKKLTAPAP